MKILAVDDEIIALEGLVKSIKEADSNAEVFSFRFADDAIKFMETSTCDVAFLDIEMYGINGVSLANILLKMNPNINIIFSTDWGIVGFCFLILGIFSFICLSAISTAVSPLKGTEPANNSYINIPNE